MKKKDIDKIKRELEAIQAADQHGLIKPEAVVEFAKNPATELHKHFTWDVSEAAKQFWIEQARGIIQEVSVTIISNGESVTHRAVVSLLPDRTNPGGGYRMLEDVLSDPVLYKQYLETALTELNAFKRKYGKIAELSPVFAAVSVVNKKISRKSKAKVSKRSVVLKQVTTETLQ